MTNKLLEILYNPGSIKTCEGHVSEENNNYQDLSDADLNLLKIFEELVVAPYESKILRQLALFQDQLRAGMSAGLRPVLIKEFNNFLQRTSVRYPKAEPLFLQSLQIIIEFKKLGDKQGDHPGNLGQNEWVELERSLFFLTQWEQSLGIEPEEMMLYVD